VLQVSRSEVSTDSFTEYQKDSRFIKLPVDKYWELIGMTPNGPQIAMTNAINDPRYRFVVAAYSRRVGKTEAANIIGQLVSLVPGCHVLIMSPNYSLSQISFEKQRELLRKFDVEVERDNAKDRIIELANGSTIRIGSISQVDSCVGRSYDLIIFDEAALTSEGEHAFSVALRPTLDRATSKCIFISTPRGKNNWFSSYFDRGSSPEFPQWISLHCDWRENPRVSEEDINEARKSISKAEFEQEYEASFNSYLGQIYKFNSECIENLSEMDILRSEVIMGLDIGFKDYTAGCVIAYSYDDETYYVLAEYYENERTTKSHAEKIKALEAKYNIQFIFVDSAAAQTRYDWAVNYDLSTIGANKSILDGIAHVQNIIENDRLIVDVKCRHVLACLDQYRWDANSALKQERPKHDQYSHMADALRYALYSYNTSVGTV
jgi:phage terminase large subunit